jgi:class 3 adenylate cyclase
LYAALVARADPTIKLPREILLTPRRHLETLPTYALVDVLKCSDDAGALAEVFRDKIVIIGADSAMEDRVESSGRYLAPVPYNMPLIATCGLRQLGASNPAAGTVPGVFVHAAAVDEVMSGDVTKTATVPFVAVIAAAAAAFVAVIAMFMSPPLAIVGALSLLVAIFGAATTALQHDFYIPILLPILATCVTPLEAYAARYLVEQRTRRSIENAFNHYLSPTIVARLAEDPSALKLGGERREITVMFADLSGFTAMSGKVEPEILTAKINRYLGLVSQEVELTGGYVDKFIGDSVMAFWGAPAADPHHAVNAIRTAMSALERVEHARVEDESRGEPAFSIKMGINSGSVVVGNVGTERRFNYTAVGETVNIASRLEGVPHIYQCHIVVGAHTAELAKSVYLLRELDRIVVKGASEPMAIYEAICELSAATPGQVRKLDRYADALRMFREMRFEEAALAWDELDELDRGADSNGHNQPPGPHSPASAMAQLARELAANPPKGPWDGARVLASK